MITTIMTPEQYSKISYTLPDQPGIYKYYDASGELLYVGKAKQLRKRVSSYFTKQAQNQKTLELVKRIERINLLLSTPRRMHFYWKILWSKNSVHVSIFY